MPVHTGPSTPPQAAAILGLILLALDVAVALYFINDLYKPERRVAGGDKTVWMVIILFGSIIGWLAYLSFGRES